MVPLSYGLGNLTERSDDVNLLFDALPAQTAQTKVRCRHIALVGIPYLKLRKNQRANKFLGGGLRQSDGLGYDFVADTSYWLSEVEARKLSD